MQTYWKDVSTNNLPGPRAAHSCDVLDGHLYVFGGWNGKKALNDLQVLNIATGQWCEVTSTGDLPPSARNNHATVVVGTQIYMHGGHDGTKWLNDLHSIDTENLFTSDASPSFQPDHAISAANSAAAAANGYIMRPVGATGGDSGDPAADSGSVPAHSASGGSGEEWGEGANPATTSTTPIIDFSEKQKLKITWKKLHTQAQPPSARACHTISRIGRKLVLFGGYDGGRCFNDTVLLDLDTLTWIHPAITGPLPPPRNAHAIAVVGHRLYLFGGHSGSKHLRDLFIFNTTTFTWEEPDMQGTAPPGLRGHSMNFVGNRIFLFGGYDGRERSNDLYVMDPVEMRWSHQPEAQGAPSGRQRHSSCLVGCKDLYIFGGFDGKKWLNDIHIMDVGRLEENALNGVAVAGLVSSMQSLVNNRNFADVTFVLGGERIYAHKVILWAQCPYFKAMFESDMRESQAGADIEVNNWSAQAFMAFLEFLYTGRVPHDVKCELAIELLGLADQYTLDSLKKICQNLLMHHVDTDSVCSIVKHAETYQADDLKTYCMSYLLKNFEVVAKSPSFDSLSSSPALLLEVTRMTCNRNARVNF